jgi:hypothetical protein
MTTGSYEHFPSPSAADLLRDGIRQRYHLESLEMSDLLQLEHDESGDLYTLDPNRKIVVVEHTASALGPDAERYWIDGCGDIVHKRSGSRQHLGVAAIQKYIAYPEPEDGETVSIVGAGVVAELFVVMGAARRRKK